MSNLLAAIDQEALGWLIATAATALALFLILLTRTYRLGSVLGPSRAPFDEPIAPWGAAVFIGALVWMGSQVVYGTYIGATPTATPTAAHDATEPPTTRASLDLQPHDLAILSTVPPILGATAMVLVAVGSRGWLTRVGLGLDRLPKAIVPAAIGILVSYPIVFWALQVMERLYQAVQYEHAESHEVLQQLASQPSPAIRFALIIGATLAAPVFEELFFRGGLQTILRWFFTRLSAGRESPMSAWAPIIIVSILFGMIHELWMAPAIFVLSLCLGYLYERTGNLWACIFMHAIFNTLNTVFFLA